MSKRKKSPKRLFVLVTSAGDVLAFTKAKQRKMWLQGEPYQSEYTKETYILEVK